MKGGQDVQDTLPSREKAWAGPSSTRASVSVTESSFHDISQPASTLWRLELPHRVARWVQAPTHLKLEPNWN
jgi:hypothetical protein